MYLLFLKKIVKALKEPKPILEIISLSLREMFDEKNNIENPTEMPKEIMQEYVYVLFNTCNIEIDYFL